LLAMFRIHLIPETHIQYAFEVACQLARDEILPPQRYVNVSICLVWRWSMMLTDACGKIATRQYYYESPHRCNY
jgi:hypothetical protein